MSEFLKWIRSRKNSNSSSTPPDLANADLSDLRAGLNYGDLKKAIRIGHQQADLSWKKKYYTLRTVWATLSIVLLGLSLWFTFWLVNGLGKGELDFREYKTFLNIIAGEIIIHVLGLVAIVMHFLFPKNGDPKNGLRN